MIKQRSFLKAAKVSSVARGLANQASTGTLVKGLAEPCEGAEACCCAFIAKKKKEDRTACPSLSTCS